MSKNTEKRRYNMRSLCNFTGLNNIEGVKALLSEGVDVNEKQGCKAPIHVAAEEGNIEILQLLIEAGADVNIRDHILDRTPLFLAKDEKTAKILVQAGADLDAKDCILQNAFFMATIRNNKLPVVEFLVESCGFDVDARSYSGSTPLQAACEFTFCKGNFSTKIVKYLLRKNAKINNVSSDLHTSNVHTPVVILLLRSVQAYALNYSIPKFIQFLKFLLRYSDVTNLNFSGFNDSYVHMVDKNTCFIFLEHVSVLISLGIVIHSHEKFISERQDYKDHFDKCQNELLVAKSTKIGNSWVTFFKILTDSNKKLKNYAGNEDLVNDFKSTDFSNKFPFYGATMQEKMEKAVKRRALFDRSCILFSHRLPIFDSYHLIVRDILDCVLSTKDLSKFCE